MHLVIISLIIKFGIHLLFTSLTNLHFILIKLKTDSLAPQIIILIPSVIINSKCLFRINFTITDAKTCTNLTTIIIMIFSSPKFNKKAPGIHFLD